ncbi:SLC13 family permease [Candidatus Mycobacterium methanotrophicum]|uniref:ArsB/NhaD family transporter n=1 Tax=Candidatus Mycobacterium methanotrophicum TaxID=2943498 RepID=A0ABY4QRC8_9MYCO|nr:ArsB/NhaD family transporter [Candidatus Mycobacterium methanotrophicum]UQX13204.1 ArsB/NhaD family transporter [Candidatus Mycobacterium methanotrophicum]
MMWFAVTVFTVAYAFIISERFNKTKVALVGAGLMIFLPVIDSPDVFYSQATGIDWDVIFLMLGMMIIVSILRQTGVFEYAAIWAAKRANGSPLRIMILLMLVMAMASALLPNVVSVLLIAPVTLLVCDRLAINPVPMLMAEVFASNIGGAATLVGDPPNIIIGARKGLSFNAFLFNMAPIVIIVMLVMVAVSPLLFRGFSTVSPEKVAAVMALEEGELLRDRKLLINCGAVMAVVFAGFIVSPTIHIQPSLVALLGAGALILVSKMEQSEYLSNVEWETLLFIVGLFIMVGALLKTGVIKHLGTMAANATGGSVLVTTMLILGVSTLASGVIDNVPYVATMTPIVGHLASLIPGQSHHHVLWWSLALGGDLGGNLTAVGSSANIVMIGIALRSGYSISFWEFTRKGIVITAISTVLCGVYLWLRYFVLG